MRVKGVYFRVEKSHNYMLNWLITFWNLELGASGRTDEETARKENPVDFALWKSSKPGEIFWGIAWGLGHVGVGILCSFMCRQIL